MESFGGNEAAKSGSLGRKKTKRGIKEGSLTDLNKGSGNRSRRELMAQEECLKEGEHSQASRSFRTKNEGILVHSRTSRSLGLKDLPSPHNFLTPSANNTKRSIENPVHVNFNLDNNIELKSAVLSNGTSVEKFSKDTQTERGHIPVKIIEKTDAEVQTDVIIKPKPVTIESYAQTDKALKSTQTTQTDAIEEKDRLSPSLNLEIINKEQNIKYNKSILSKKRMSVPAMPQGATSEQEVKNMEDGELWANEDELFAEDLNDFIAFTLELLDKNKPELTLERAKMLLEQAVNQ